MRYLLMGMIPAIVLLAGCSTQLTEAGSKVELITPTAADQCDMMDMFKVTGSSTDDVLHKVLNHVAEIGGDSAGISSGRDVADGREVTAVALKCHK